MMCSKGSCVHDWTVTSSTTMSLHCESSPCLNGGLCINMTDRFVCECVNGYSGLIKFIFTSEIHAV